MRFRVLAVISAAFALAFTAVPSASANSFNKEVGGGVFVSYDDGGDSFCLRVAASSGYDVASVNLDPAVAGRGPSYSFSVTRGDKKCRSLATAYEDSRYEYFGTMGYDPPCRCADRYSGGFYS